MKAYKKGLRRYQLGLDRVLRRIERRLKKGMTRALIKDFDELGVRAAKVFAERAPMLDLDMDFEAKAFGTKGQDEDNAARIVVAMDVDDWAKNHLKKTLVKHQTQAFTQTRDAVNDTLRVQLDPEGTVQRQLLNELGTRKGLKDIDNDIRESLVRAIKRGRLEGMTTDQIGDLIKREVPKGRFVNAGKKYRAEMIARTEMRFAVNKSSMALYRNAPEISAVVAVDGEDDDVCAERNGTQYTFDQAEAEDAATHPNCTLRWVPVVAGK